jgi:hypothetical protein
VGVLRPDGVLLAVVGASMGEGHVFGLGFAVVIGVLVDVYGDVRSAPHRREFSLRDLDTLMVSGRSEIRVEDDIRFYLFYNKEIKITKTIIRYTLDPI